MIAVPIALCVPRQAHLVMSIYSAATWCGVFALVLRDWMRLEHHLRKEHPEKWAEISLPTFAIRRWLRSGETFGDPRLALLVRNARLAGWLPVILFGLYPLLIGWGVYLMASH